MQDNELSILKDWRFVPIPYGTKGPKIKDWHKKPYTLEQVPDNHNIGVICGPTSNGLLAIDFDGKFAWEYWLDNIKIPFDSFDTVMWTSNKPYRCQMAFTVPVDFWQYMPDCFKVLGPVNQDNKHEALEFRWGNERGIQSVLPPSLHPDTNQQYSWLRKPSEVNVSEAPIELLEWAYNYQQKKETFVPEIIKYEPKTITGEEANKIAEKLKMYYPTLDYDAWIRVTWGFCNTIGYSDGIMIMKYYYPEQKQGEYKKLISTKHSGKICTMGTIIKMIKDKGGVINTSIKDDLFYQTKISRKFI